MEPNLLKHVPLFQELKEDELEALASVALYKTFPKNTVILLAEEEGDTLFIIDKGRVKVTILSEDGRELILDILSKGDFFGEMSLLDGRPRSATVVAIEDSELLILRRGDFIRLIERIPRIAAQVMAILASRLRKADQKIEGLALLDVTGRVAGTLQQLAQEHGVSVEDGIMIQNRPTHQVLANMSATTRETVSRVLKKLEHQGFISTQGKNVIILRDREAKEDITN